MTQLQLLDLKLFFGVITDDEKIELLELIKSEEFEEIP